MSLCHFLQRMHFWCQWFWIQELFLSDIVSREESSSFCFATPNKECKTPHSFLGCPVYRELQTHLSRSAYDYPIMIIECSTFPMQSTANALYGSLWFQWWCSWPAFVLLYSSSISAVERQDRIGSTMPIDNIKIVGDNIRILVDIIKCYLQGISLHGKVNY